MLVGLAATGVGAAAGSGSAAAGPRVTGLEVSASWFSARGRGATSEIVVGFRLERPGTVRFSLTQVAPVCRSVGAFTVDGTPGLNRFLFPGRIERRLLPPGTYRLAAAGARGLFARALVVVATEAPDPRRVRRALLRDVCRSGAGEAATQQGTRESAPPPPGPAAAEPTGRERPLRPFVVGCLLVAIALLGIAAVPGTATASPRAAELLATHRGAVAFAGSVALAAAVGLYVATLL